MTSIACVRLVLRPYSCECYCSMMRFAIRNSTVVERGPLLVEAGAVSLTSVNEMSDLRRFMKNFESNVRTPFRAQVAFNQMLGRLSGRR